MTGCGDTEARTRLERPPLPASRPDSSGCTEGQQVIIGWLVELDQRRRPVPVACRWSVTCLRSQV